MKRVAAILLATMMVFSLAACSSDSSSSESSGEETKEEETEVAEDAAAATADVEFDVEPEFEPSADYDKYTCIEYNLAGEDVPVTVCSNDAETDFELLCNFFGDDQDWRGTWDGTDVETEYDLTSFMSGDAPGIIEEAVKQGKWKTI